MNLKNSAFIIVNIIFSSYLYPSFAVFYLYYLFKISEKNKILTIKIYIYFDSWNQLSNKVMMIRFNRH